MDRRTAVRALAAATALPVLSPEALSGLLNARNTLACATPPEPFLPAALNARQLEVVKVVSDIILPRTATPSATDLGVHEFIDLIVDEWMDSAESGRFKAGLDALEDAANTNHRSGFLDLTPDVQTALVRQLDDDLEDLRTTNLEDESPNDSFFHWMKRLTLTGYFTSEEGAALLDYRTIPGTFEGCLVPEPAP